jgi:hypothetical protein
MVAVANPYANQDLFIAADVSDRMSDLVARSDKEGAKPFPRQVDAWWLALGLGVRIGERTALPGKTVKFNDGGILATDPWRITQLELLALAQEGAEALDGPAGVIRIASEFANTGFQWLIDKLLGEAEPTLTLMNRLSEFVGEGS